MPTPLGRAFKLARSPAGRKVLKQAVKVARSEEGRKLIAEARKMAKSPEGQRLLDQARRLVKLPSEAVHAPETKTRIQALRDRVGKRKP